MSSTSRRHILAKISLFSVGLLSSNFAFGLGRFKSMAVRESSIHFPEGKTFADFQRDLGTWMDVPTWKAFLEDQRASGALLSVRRTNQKSSVTYYFAFRSREDMRNFEKAAVIKCRVDISRRDAAGYRGQVSSFA